MSADALRFAAGFDRVADWSDRTFGPPETRGPLGPIRHLAKECKEAADAFTNPNASVLDFVKEVADLQILVFDIARRAGMTVGSLAAAVHAKMVENERRKWAASKPEGGAPK